VIYKLTLDHKLNAEQAKAYYSETGNCVFCQKTITTDESLSVGYGSVCAKKHGLPHPLNGDK